MTDFLPVHLDDTYALSPIPHKANHYRVWIGGREVGYLRLATEATPWVWRACDDAGERVVEEFARDKTAELFAAQIIGGTP